MAPSGGTVQRSEDALCAICKNIDFVSIFTPRPSNVVAPAPIDLGSFADITQKPECPLCRMVVHILVEIIGTNNLPKVRELSSQFTKLECSLSPSTFNGASVLDVHINNEGTEIFDRLRIPTVGYGIRVTGQSALSIGLRYPLGGRVLRSRIDFNVVRSWLSRCEMEHRQHCENLVRRGLVQAPNSLRAIDVQEMRIKKVEPDCRYLALSYVWGSAKVLLALKANIDELSSPNGLNISDDRIPKTIRDAIVLTQEFGERYLWVDSLCIIQDDEVNKAEQISTMDRVYGGALLTIVAAFGTDANAGIPGALPESRTISQRVECINNLEIVSFLDKYRRESQPHQWNSRAWTYQERVLSTRILTVTSQQAQFECSCYHWVEDMCGEEDPLAYRHGYETSIAGRFRSTFTLRILQPANRESGKTLDAAFVSEEYLRAVQEYTRRDISYESDILNALTGIMNIFRAHGDLQFSYGLPTKHFMQFLTWKSDGLCERRSGFPSWSWTGWKGAIEFPQLQRDDSSFIPFTHNEQGDVVLEDAVIDEFDNQKLWIWTNVAYFSLGPKKTPKLIPRKGRARLGHENQLELQFVEITILDGNGYFCGEIRVTDAKWYEDWKGGQHGQLYELLEFSSGVMLVERRGDVTYRVGYGTIDKSDWNLAKPSRMRVQLG